MFSKVSNVALVVMLIDTSAAIVEFVTHGQVGDVFYISLSISMAALLIVKAIEKGKQ